MRKSREEVLQSANTILGYIEKKTLTETEQKQIVEDSVYNFTHYVNEAILKNRKSVSTDYSVVEWVGEGAVFRDTKGDEYIDCLGGYGVFLLGHRHPNVVNAVKSQIDRYALHSQELVDPLRGYLSKLLAEITPGDLQHSYLVNCGTEANEMALKLARLATGKKCFISMENGFHGKTFGSLSASGKAMFRTPYMPLVPGFQHVEFGDADAVETAIQKLIATGETVAGIIVEPTQGEGGVNLAPKGYFKRLREICDKYECLLIVDEVQTGMGRTGTLFGVDHFDVVPDIMTLGKALGGGVMPIAAMVARDHLWDKMEENPFLLGSSTFGGNPLCCSAAIAGIKTILEEDIPKQAEEKGDYILERLRKIQAQYPQVLKEVRGLGLLIGMEFTSNELGYTLAKLLFGEKILVSGTINNAKVIRLEPPAVISYEQLDIVLAAIEKHINALAKQQEELAVN
ncbi:putrescine aminotransferase [Bacillus massiliigorillae]|uniref:putrescine aminotransferase n=1 Tax=Bacillus massiliigorillae TaxID=1243664 RepID=UPI0003A3BFCF|nr:putrescine aminotransferase [Bacillus massiliigorillae]